MELVIIAVFVVGYALITLEHNLHIDKSAPALLTGMTLWAVYALMGNHIDSHAVHGELTHHMGEISEILFFLLGAMTIVEIIDAHDGFHVITGLIKTRSKRKMLWIVCVLTFFLSAVLDNLTTAIVMASLLRRLIPHQIHRIIFAGLVVISANAGGAWSPMGDVTTTMLWIGEQISLVPTVKTVFLPSLVCLLIPLVIVTNRLKGNFRKNELVTNYRTTRSERLGILLLGIGCLLFVPVFKTITHLPPFTGMLFGVGVLWTVTELMHKSKEVEEKSRFSVLHALTKVDAASVLFFLGILCAVAALQSAGVLKHLSEWIAVTVHNTDIVVMLIGAFSAVVDNVPLVAAAQNMYEISTPEMIEAAADPAQREYLSHFAQDAKFWQFLTYCAGTGGSILIIGSAAGVAIMGMERIRFFWYLWNIGPLAVAGYIGGCLTYLGLYSLGWQ